MVLGSSNNYEKRSSQEAMQELKLSDEPQGGELGVANFIDREVRQTQSEHVWQESKECMVVNMNITIISMITQFRT